MLQFPPRKTKEKLRKNFASHSIFKIRTHIIFLSQFPSNFHIIIITMMSLMNENILRYGLAPSQKKQKWTGGTKHFSWFSNAKIILFHSARHSLTYLPSRKTCASHVTLIYLTQKNVAGELQIRFLSYIFYSVEIISIFASVNFKLLWQLW